MAERGSVDALDGIVVLELSLDADSGWEILATIGCIRAGAAALAQMPHRGSDVTGMLHTSAVSVIGHRIADELVAEAARVYEARAAEHRRRSKEQARESRAREREAKRASH